MQSELGFEEKQTSEKIASTLEGLGFRVRRGVGKTGVVGEIGDGKPVVGIRADMDALPILEKGATVDLSAIETWPELLTQNGHS